MHLMVRAHGAGAGSAAVWVGHVAAWQCLQPHGVQLAAAAALRR